jgi:hypothetical protein
MHVPQRLKNLIPFRKVKDRTPSQPAASAAQAPPSPSAPTDTVDRLQRLNAQSARARGSFFKTVLPDGMPGALPPGAATLEGVGASPFRRSNHLARSRLIDTMKDAPQPSQSTVSLERSASLDSVGSVSGPSGTLTPITAAAWTPDPFGSDPFPEPPITAPAEKSTPPSSGHSEELDSMKFPDPPLVAPRHMAIQLDSEPESIGSDVSEAPARYAGPKSNSESVVRVSKDGLEASLDMEVGLLTLKLQSS